MIEAEQGSRRVGTAATDAAAHGQTFDQFYIGALAASAMALQQASCTHDQVVFMIDTRQFGVQVNLTVYAWREGQFIAMVEELEQRLQLVIAIGTAAKHMQHQVELGWSR